MMMIRKQAIDRDGKIQYLASCQKAAETHKMAELYFLSQTRRQILNQESRFQFAYNSLVKSQFCLL